MKVNKYEQEPIFVGTLLKQSLGLVWKVSVLIGLVGHIGVIVQQLASREFRRESGNVKLESRVMMGVWMITTKVKSATTAEHTQNGSSLPHAQ